MIVHVHTQAHTEREIGVYWYTHTHAHKHFCTNTLTRCERGTQGLGFRLRVYINTHTLYLYLSLSHSTHLCRLNTPTVERLTALVQLWETGDKLAFNSAIIHGHDLLRMPPEKWPELREIRPKGWWVTCIGETLLKPCAGCKNLYDTQALDKDSSHCANCRTANPPSDMPAKKHRPLNYYFEPSSEGPSLTEPRLKRRRMSQHTLEETVTRHKEKTYTPPFTPNQEELQAIRGFDLNPRYGPITGRSRDERAALGTSLDISLPPLIRQLQQRIGTLDDNSLGPQTPIR
jgi:hypothetical protein